MNFKEEVYLHCNKIIDQRIALAQKLIEDAQIASSQDTKSSMGDKYETSREMMALEMRKAGEQLQEASKLKRVLSGLRINKSFENIELGSLVSTSIGDFFLGISLGEIEIQAKKIFVLSVVAPLGQQLLNKRVGDEFEFNSQKIQILAIS